MKRCSGEAYNVTKIKTYGNFVTFANFELLKLEVQTLVVVRAYVAIDPTSTTQYTQNDII
jgi:hypothetical protein